MVGDRSRSRRGRSRAPAYTITGPDRMGRTLADPHEGHTIMGIIGRIAGWLGRGERAAPDWQILVEIDGVPRVVTLPGPLGVAWGRSPVGSDDFERAVAEVHRRIALAQLVVRSATPRPAKTVAA